LRQELARHESEVKRLRKQLPQLQQIYDEAQTKYTQEQNRFNRSVRGISREIGRWKVLVEQADEYESSLRELGEAEERQASIDQACRESLQQWPRAWNGPRWCFGGATRWAVGLADDAKVKANPSVGDSCKQPILVNITRGKAELHAVSMALGLAQSALKDGRRHTQHCEDATDRRLHFRSLAAKHGDHDSRLPEDAVRRGIHDVEMW